MADSIVRFASTRPMSLGLGGYIFWDILCPDLRRLVGDVGVKGWRGNVLAADRMMEPGASN